MVKNEAMDRDAHDGHMEDTPAYAALKASGLLCTKYRRLDIAGGRGAHVSAATATADDAACPRQRQHPRPAVFSH